MQRFLVISYDPQEQQAFCDVVEAQNPNEARGVVDAIRDYAIAVDALTPAELRALADDAETRTSRQIAGAIMGLRTREA
jgi:hypothetical protein